MAAKVLSMGTLDGNAEKNHVKPGSRSFGSSKFTGFEAGDRIVVEGTSKLRPGSPWWNSVASRSSRYQRSTDQLICHYRISPYDARIRRGCQLAADVLGVCLYAIATS